MEKSRSSDQTLSFATIPSVNSEEGLCNCSSVVDASSPDFVHKDACIQGPPDAEITEEPHEAAAVADRPLFMGQTPTAQHLLAAMDAQTDAITIRGLHFVTPQPVPNDAPGASEKETGIRMVNQKRYGKAAHCLERAIELGQDDYACQMNLALAYTRLGRLEEAIALLLDLRKIHPADAGIATLLGQSFLLSGKRQEAITVLASASLSHPDRFHLHYYLGIAYAKQDQTAHAMEAWQKAATIRPNHKEIKQWLSIGEKRMHA